MAALPIITVSIVIISILIGVLNYSPDDSISYRKMVEYSMSQSFTHGCFCIYNTVYDTEFKVGDLCSKECSAQILVHNNVFYKRLVLGGPVGLGETYTDNIWSYNDDKYDLADVLTELVVGVSNGDRSIIDYIGDFLTIEKWQQWYERKYAVTKSQKEDKESVQSHYDVGDDVFETFLDDTMFYTCAIFKNAQQSLHEAQLNKMNILSTKLNIDSSDNVLDLGCGWGYSPYHIHKTTGATAVGLTMSKNQYDYAKERYAKEVGDTDKLEYKYLDYRNAHKLTKYKFNKIISIGMTEHVGIKNIEQLFNVSALVLDKTRDSIFALHYIATSDIAPMRRAVSYREACSRQMWIFKYIFPGACMLDPSWVQSAAMKYGFFLLHQEYYGIHYAKTLSLWREKWNEPNTKKMIQEKYSDINLWRVYEYYFAMSEALFRSGHITLVHQVYVKPNKQNTKKYADFDYMLGKFKMPNQK